MCDRQQRHQQLILEVLQTASWGLVKVILTAS